MLQRVETLGAVKSHHRMHTTFLVRMWRELLATPQGQMRTPGENGSAIMWDGFRSRCRRNEGFLSPSRSERKEGGPLNVGLVRLNTPGFCV